MTIHLITKSKNRRSMLIRAVIGFGLVLVWATVWQGARFNVVTASDTAVKNVKTTKPTRAFVPAGACAQCHNSGSSSLRGFEVETTKSLPLVRLDESDVWTREDKHRRAFDALVGERGRKMGELLGIRDISMERSCLACHSTGFSEDLPVDDYSEAVKVRSEGVACIACHGSHEEWVGTHGIQSKFWRSLPVSVKTENYGMTNLRSTEVRAKVCSSCHVGRPSEGKLVTHAMYATGHPPLPPFELSQFTEAMSRHWWDPSEVKAFTDPVDGTKLCELNQVDRHERIKTKSLVIGAVVELRESFRVLAELAERRAVGKDAIWPEFAMMDCRSCHRELKVFVADSGAAPERFRKVGGSLGAPGLPRWPLTLIPLAIAQASSVHPGAQGSLGAALAEVDAAFRSKPPFGDLATLSRASNRVVEWSDAMLAALHSTAFDQTHLTRLRDALDELSSQAIVDRDSARQTAWAVKSLEEELRNGAPRSADAKAAFSALDRLLKLNPDESRSGRKRIVDASGSDLSSENLRLKMTAISEGEIQKSLDSARSFEAAKVNDALRNFLKAAGMGSALPKAIP